MSAETARVLREARKLIERPEAWTRGAFARSSAQWPVASDDAEAACWCIHGAINRISRIACREDGAMDAKIALRNALPASIALFNDDPSTTHADVLAAFDRAIAAEDREP